MFLFSCMPMFALVIMACRNVFELGKFCQESFMTMAMYLLFVPIGSEIVGLKKVVQSLIQQCFKFLVT